MRSALSLKDQINLSKVCISLFTTFKKFNEIPLIELLQSIVDDDSKAVERILKIKPFLLFEEPKKNLVLESKLTGQKFYAEKPAVMAAKRKQINMLTLLLSYYDKLEQTEGLRKSKVDALSAWSSSY